MSTAGISQDYLNGQSAAILVVFVVVSVFVIWPVRIPLLDVVQRSLLRVLRNLKIIGRQRFDVWSRQRLHFPLSLETAPLIGVLLLLATTTIDGSTIRLGIKGDENVKPYDVLVLFISLAYIVIALDGTGALEAVAFWVSKRGGSSGPRLFGYLYAFFLLTGCVVGNDPLILSGTPFLAYLTKYTNLDPTAWIFSEFMAANTASAVLVSSNPTNILITGSFSLNYLTDFTKWTILPSIVPGILNYFILYFMFRDRIPKLLVPLKDDPWTKLRDAKGAIFLSILMLVTIAVLVGTSFVPGHGAEVWMITAPAGVLALTFELVSDWIDPVHQREVVARAGSDAATELRTRSRQLSVPDRTLTEAQRRGETVHKHDIDGLDGPDDPTYRLPRTVDCDLQSPTLSSQLSKQQALSQPGGPPHHNHDQPSSSLASSSSSSSSPHPITLESILLDVGHRFPRTTRTISLLPLPLLPFAAAEFILVRGLAQRAWITVFASGFAHATPNPAASTFFFGFVSSAFLCPFAGTNIGATILLVEVLRDPAYANSAAVTRDPRVLKAAIYATAMGSNLGAFSYVFAASLAGLLWKKLLHDKGVGVSRWQFCWVNLGPLVVQTAVACAIVLGEVYWFS